MAYDVPNAEAFKARYQEFDAVPDDLVSAALADAARVVTTRWLERDFAPAIMLLAAHSLASEGAIERAAGKTSTVTTTGPITQKKVGDVSVTYGGASVGADGLSDGGTGYNGTEYGRRFLRLMRGNFAGPMVA